MDAEGDEVVDGEALSEERVNFLGEFGADAVNAHGNEVIGRRFFAEEDRAWRG